MTDPQLTDAQRLQAEPWFDVNGNRRRDFESLLDLLFTEHARLETELAPARQVVEAARILDTARTLGLRRVKEALAALDQHTKVSE